MSALTSNLGKNRKKSPLDGIAELMEFAATHPEIGHRVHLVQCLQFVEMYLEHARDLAKEGHKDQARDWLRFFRNSQILEILVHEKAGNPEQLAELRKNVALLNSECHPLDVANYATDLQAIRATLQQILLKVSGEPELKVLDNPKHKPK